LLGSAAGVLASVLDSSDPDGFPSGAVPGAIIGAIMLGLVGLFFDSSVGGADDPVARRVKASLSGIPVVVVLVLLERSAATQVVLGWTRQTPDDPCKTLDPSQPFGACVPKYGSRALRLLAFDIVLLALFRVASSTSTRGPPTGSRRIAGGRGKIDERERVWLSALPFGDRDRSHQLQGAVSEGGRTTLEELADGHPDRHGAEEPHLEDLDDHSALPALEFSSSTYRHVGRRS
jgi:hypothetical protein